MAYERAIEIGEGTMIMHDVYTNLGSLMYEVGHDDKAREAFIRSFQATLVHGGVVAIEPSALIRTALLIPSTPTSLEDSVKTLRRFEARLKDLTTLIELGGLGLEDPGSSDLFDMGGGLFEMEQIRSIPVRF